MIFPSSPTTTVSFLAAAGIANHVATAKLLIEEVCDRQDALLETTMAGFRSFADALDHCQPLMPASFESIKDEDTNDKNEDIYIVCWSTTPTTQLRRLWSSLPPIRLNPMRM